jgi:DNA-binding IscR family transcriptional regulator
MLGVLVEEGLLHRVGAADEAYVLARPPMRISTADLLRAMQRLTDRAEPQESPAWRWVRSFREAQLSLAIHRPLAEL